MIDNYGAYRDAGYSPSVGYDPAVLALKHKYREYKMLARERGRDGIGRGDEKETIILSTTSYREESARGQGGGVNIENGDSLILPKHKEREHTSIDNGGGEDDKGRKESDNHNFFPESLLIFLWPAVIGACICWKLFYWSIHEY